MWYVRIAISPYLMQAAGPVYASHVRSTREFEKAKMPNYKCSECKQTMYLMVDNKQVKLFCPRCTKAKRRQVKLVRA